MGSTSSKVGRKLPRATGSAAATAEARPEKPLTAFESSKNEAIEHSAKDPRFMAKLNQLGPVRVDHHMNTTLDFQASDVQSMYRSRMRSEAEASRLASMKNRLLASSLADLLDARKSVTDRTELETLATRYHVDVVKLERLSRVVNTPSTDESTVVRTRDKHGGESLTMMARWVNPVALSLNVEH